MSTKINVIHEGDLTRQDTFRVNPDDVLVGRNPRNPDGKSQSSDYDEQVQSIALSIAQDTQLQPVGVRRNTENQLVLTFGFTRRDAVALLRKGFNAVDPRDGEKRFFHDKDATLWVKIDDCTDDEAFLRGIKENLERNSVTDYQEALQQQTIRETLQWPDAQIARFYGYTNQNRVAALSKLLTLPTKRQQQVHEGKLALYTALETLKLDDPDEREKILDAALVGSKIDGTQVKKLIRDSKLEAIEEAVEAGTVVASKKSKKGRKAETEGAVRRTTSDFRKLCDEVTAESTVANPKIKDLFATLKKWIDGGCADRSIWTRINELK